MPENDHPTDSTTPDPHPGCSWSDWTADPAVGVAVTLVGCLIAVLVVMKLMGGH